MFAELIVVGVRGTRPRRRTAECDAPRRLSRRNVRHRPMSSRVGARHPKAGDRGRRPGAGERRRSEVAHSAYGPSAVLTPANLVTLVRFLGVPVFIAMILLWGATGSTFAFGGLLAFSDGVDGWVARRQGTTSSGAFLDPLADKVIVLGALYALVANGTLWWVPVTIIAVREVAMSIYRCADEPAWRLDPRPRGSAKMKTLFQDLAIGLCIAAAAHHLYRAALRSALGGDRDDRRHGRAVLPRRPPGSGGPIGGFRCLRLTRWRGLRRLTSTRNHAHRDRRGRNRAAARPDHRHQLALARRGAGRHRRRRRTSTRRSATTTSGSFSPCVPHSPGATGRSSAGGSVPPRTTSPARRSPR